METDSLSTAKPLWLRILLILSGITSLVLGVVGIFLPLLPTTPFLLLAAACFCRSSRTLYFRLIRHPLLGEYIENYRRHRAMTLRSKIAVLVLLWIVIGHSVFAVTGRFQLQLFLIVVGAGVTAHILHLRTMPVLKADVPRQSRGFSRTTVMKGNRNEQREQMPGDRENAHARGR